MRLLPSIPAPPAAVSCQPLCFGHAHSAARAAAAPRPPPRRDENPSVPAQHAYDLLDRMHNDPSFNASWALFWESHPGPDEVFTPEVR